MTSADHQKAWANLLRASDSFTEIRRSVVHAIPNDDLEHHDYLMGVFRSVEAALSNVKGLLSYLPNMLATAAPQQHPPHRRQRSHRRAAELYVPIDGAAPSNHHIIVSVDSTSALQPSTITPPNKQRQNHASSQNIHKRNR